MARRVVWSKQALTDLKALAEYIAKDSSHYAAAFVREIRDAGRTINELSERGHIVPELNDSSVRELFIKEYRLIYSIETERVVILALVHGRRDLKRIWKQDS